MLRKIIEDKYKDGLVHLFEYLEDLYHMIISKNHMNKTMGFDKKTKKCYFYNTETCLYNMIISGMRQRYLVYKLDLFLRKRYAKVVYTNEKDLYLEPYKKEDILTIRENGFYYAFTKKDLRKIFTSAVMNIEEEVPTPKIPSNPYTRKPFNEYEMMMMHTFMGKACKLVELFKIAHYDAGRFGRDWSLAILREHLIEKVKHFSMRKVYNIIKRMCKVLGVKAPGNLAMKAYLSKYQNELYMIIAMYYEFDLNMMPTVHEFAMMRDLCMKLSSNIELVGRQLIKRRQPAVGGNAIYNAVMNNFDEEDNGVESGDSSDEDEIEDLRIQSVEFEYTEPI